MEKLIWDENFSVDVAIVDEQHKVLFDIINELIDANRIKVDSEKLSDIVIKIANYAQYHFQTEEQFMVDHNYADSTTHKGQHEEFIYKTSTFCTEIALHEEGVPIKILSYLINWLTAHILKTDMKMKPFYKEIGLK